MGGGCLPFYNFDLFFESNINGSVYNTSRMHDRHKEKACSNAVFSGQMVSALLFSLTYRHGNFILAVLEKIMFPANTI
jgi:hypothetical protein